eukprot:scaffold351662_cov21-Prasinocladus_malaysianus.AAC.1
MESTMMVKNGTSFGRRQTLRVRRSGLWAALNTYMPWSKRAGGDGHWLIILGSDITIRKASRKAW